jgi:hypothetical protein
MYNLHCESERKLNHLELRLNDILNSCKKFESKKIVINKENSINKSVRDDKLDLKEYINLYKSSVRNPSIDYIPSNYFTNKEEFYDDEPIALDSYVRKDYSSSPPKYRMMRDYTAGIYYHCIPKPDDLKKKELSNRITKIHTKQNTRDKIMELKSKNHEKTKRYKVTMKKSASGSLLLPRIR